MSFFSPTPIKPNLTTLYLTTTSLLNTAPAIPTTTPSEITFVNAIKPDNYNLQDLLQSGSGAEFALLHTNTPDPSLLAYSEPKDSLTAGIKPDFHYQAFARHAETRAFTNTAPITEGIIDTRLVSHDIHGNKTLAQSTTVNDVSYDEEAYLIHRIPIDRLVRTRGRVFVPSPNKSTPTPKYVATTTPITTELGFVVYDAERNYSYFLTMDPNDLSAETVQQKLRQAGIKESTRTYHVFLTGLGTLEAEPSTQQIEQLNQNRRKATALFTTTLPNSMITSNYNIAPQQSVKFSVQPQRGQVKLILSRVTAIPLELVTVNDQWL